MPLLLAAEEAGEQGVEHVGVMDVNWLPAVTALVVFLIAFGFLYVKVWPQIVKGLDDRQRKIRQEIDTAEDAREQAKAALAEYERELASARDEASQDRPLVASTLPHGSSPQVSCPVRNPSRSRTLDPPPACHAWHR